MTKTMRQLQTDGKEVTSLDGLDLFLVTDVSVPEDVVISFANLVSLADWIPAGETWTYASADSPTFTFTISGDKTTKYAAGQKIKLTQTSVKYFIITKVAYSSPNTTVTIYGGTDYTLANATISSPYFSKLRTPFGFPMDKTKWRVTYTNTSDATQSSPSAGTWYNASSQGITVPIGQWRVYWEAALQVIVTTAGTAINAGFAGTLSTANNTESDVELTGRYTFAMPNTLAGATGRGTIHKEKILTLTTKTAYFYNINTGIAATSVSTMGTLIPTTIVAECTYL